MKEIKEDLKEENTRLRYLRKGNVRGKTLTLRLQDRNFFDSFKM